MATVRLVIVLLVLGTVVLLVVQNTAPVLPLVILGGQTVALPLSVWLVSAIALGGLTTLVLTALLGSSGGQGSRSRAYKYRPQPFYEPADTRNAARDAAEDMASGQSDQRSSPASGSNRRPQDYHPGDQGHYGGEWQAWTNLQSSNQWNDWNAMEKATQARQSGSAGKAAGASAAGAGIGSWLFGNRKAAEENQVQQSWQELSDDWDDLEHREYRARGVSPVDENLDEINQGWDNAQDYGPPPPDFEVPQSPKRVYQDGSLYSYSYRNQSSGGQHDNIYAPADDLVYGDEGFDPEAYIDLSDQSYDQAADQTGPEDYGAGGYEGEDLEAPEVAEDGVVDADYRVIIPPSPTGEEAAGDTTASEASGSWDREDDDDDDWSQAEDALTP